MATQKIKCPNCSHEFEISETLEAQIKEHLEEEFKNKLQAQNSKFQKLEDELKAKEENLNKEIEEKLKAEKLKMWSEAQKKAEEKIREKIGLEMKDIQEQIVEKDKALIAAQEKELELRKKSRELEQKEQTMKLELERQMDLERKEIALEAKKMADEEQRLKVAEKDKQLDQMRRQIEDLKRKSEQGSMQIQGDVQENDLKHTLATTFIYDTITDVPTGINGADLVQTVFTQTGKSAGVILWESKNTKSWTDKWIEKLKDDRGKVNADICILVSQVLPASVTSFGIINGIWVTDYKSFIPLTHALRMNLVQLSQVKNSMEGRDEKMAILYKYLSGPEFRNKIENIVNAFTSMKSDLDSEKRALTRIWSKREKEIERVLSNTTELYGDMQGIVGSSIAQIDSLELDFEEQIETEHEEIVDKEDEEQPSLI